MAGEQDTLARLAGGELRELLLLIQGTDIEELELEVASTKLFFRRPAPPSAARPGADGESSLAPPGPAVVFVVAERVGFFRLAGEPANGALTVGERVALDQVLGTIDSLNVPIPVQAPRSGRLDEVLVEDGQPVEYGQPLFVIRPDED